MSLIHFRDKKLLFLILSVENCNRLLCAEGKKAVFLTVNDDLPCRHGVNLLLHLFIYL